MSQLSVFGVNSIPSKTITTAAVGIERIMPTPGLKKNSPNLNSPDKVPRRPPRRKLMAKPRTTRQVVFPMAYHVLTASRMKSSSKALMNVSWGYGRIMLPDCLRQ